MHFIKNQKKKNYVNICIYQCKNKEIEILENTFAWSWQLGSRLKWLSNEIIIFNSLNNNKLNSVALNIENKKKYFYSFPFFSISRNNKFAISLNFKKLENCRPGYGYLFSQENYDDDENFLYIWDINQNKIIQNYQNNFFSNLLNLYFKEFYLNHISWSPNNESFIVYAIDKYSRDNKIILFKNFNDVKIVKNIEKISHHEWINFNEILFFGTVGGKTSFFTYNLLNNTSYQLKFPFSHLDGHPNSSDGNFFIMDTYPNKFHERYLYSFNLKENHFNFLGSAFSDLNLTKERKCDFHPKVSLSNKKIIFDTSHNLRRDFFILDN